MSTFINWRSSRVPTLREKSEHTHLILPSPEDFLIAPVKKKKVIALFRNLEFGTLIRVITTSYQNPILTWSLQEVFYEHSQKLVARGNPHPWGQKADSLLGGWGVEEWGLMGMESLSGMMEMFQDRAWWRLHERGNMLKTIELYTWEGCTWHYIHTVSIK